MYLLKNIYPKSDSIWHAHLYRIDHDEGETLWSWSPFDENFYEIQNFGVFRFM